jgi:hypothetical protein
MKNVFTALAGLIFSATIKFLKPDGTEGETDGIPTWSTSRPDLIEITPSEDGYSAKIRSLGAIGTASIVVGADADLGEGVQEIIITDQIQFIEPMVVTGQISLEPEIAEPEVTTGEINIESVAVTETVGSWDAEDPLTGTNTAPV